MKSQVYQKKTLISLMINGFIKNFVALFENNNKRDFQRLKDFITS
ncbi:MAG: hypothetical protein ABIR31_11335 [Ginsengibacter sp.]